jgi:hypothetical protein
MAASFSGPIRTNNGLDRADKAEVMCGNVHQLVKCLNRVGVYFSTHDIVWISVPGISCK